MVARPRADAGDNNRTKERQWLTDAWKKKQNRKSGAVIINKTAHTVNHMKNFGQFKLAIIITVYVSTEKNKFFNVKETKRTYMKNAEKKRE